MTRACGSIYLFLNKEHVVVFKMLFIQDGDDAKEVRKWICRSDASYQEKLLACGAFIVAELRMQVLKETEFTCSAGIAHNKASCILGVFIIMSLISYNTFLRIRP